MNCNQEPSILAKRGFYNFLSVFLIRTNGFVDKRYHIYFILQIWGVVTFAAPKTLPENSTNIYFPYKTRPQEIKQCLNDPQLARKLAEIELLRQKVRVKQWDWHKIIPKEKIRRCFNEVSLDGSFVGLSPESALNFHIKAKTSIGQNRRKGEALMERAGNRLRPMIEHWNRGNISHSSENKSKLIRALNFYFNYEYFRTDGRWVASAFNMPYLACVAYFTFLRDMNAAESGKNNDPNILRLNSLCKAVASQCFFEEQSNRPGPILTLQSFSKHGHWTSGNFGYRPLLNTALMCRNPLMVDILVEVIKKSWNPVSFNTAKNAFWKDGFTADGLGWGHGRQNYITRYPSSFLLSSLTQIYNLKDTLWYKDFSPEAFAPCVNYIKNAIWYCYHTEKNGPTPLTPDRVFFQYLPYKPHRGFGVILGSAGVLLKLLPQDSAERKEIQNCFDIITGEKTDVSGCRYFWNNDDLIFRRPDFFIGIGMVSKRSNSNEVVSATSIKTDFLGDGITAFIKRPGTYSKAKGFWDPCAVPGITARQGTYKHVKDTWTGYTGIHNFAGGVAENGSGMAAFIYEKAENKGIGTPHLYKVKAHKAYFAFEHEIICLGAGIINLNKNIPGTIQTTVDQTEWVGPLDYIQNDKVFRIQPGNNVQTVAKMVFHEGIGYIALQGIFNIRGETRSERWLEFANNYNKNRTDRPRKLPILQIAFDHGINVNNGAYAYLVNMRTASLTDLKKYFRKNPFLILSNTTHLQAVKHNRMNITQAVFYDKNAVLRFSGHSWRSNAPIVMQVREKKGQIIICVNDPKQNQHLNSIIISVEPPINGQNYFKIALPQGTYCGQPVIKEFQKASYRPKGKK